jgi:hypothetical protein
MVMKNLMNGILDTYVYQGSDYQNVNQTTFFTSIFPLYFLNSPDNLAILQSGKSNASRISNLFTRQTDPKRKESKFRERFIQTFDEYFVEETLVACRYLLRNYNKTAFDNWINELLITDMELRSDENMFFYKQISSSFKDKPYIALTLIVFWAFHIDDFKPLIQVLEQHPGIISGSNSGNLVENNPIQPLINLMDQYNLSVMDVYDFIDIAYKYGISGHLGAIAIKTYVDSQTRNNPLVSAELADMYFYGNNFRKPNPEKAMNLYMINAGMNYGSALWSVGQISSNERFDVNQTPVKQSMHYYERAIQSNHALSYNNIGKWWIYALHYHLDKVVGIPNYRNIFANRGRQAISDIYQVMHAKSEFNSFLDKHGLSTKIDFSTLTSKEKEALIANIESAEDFIVEEFVMQAYYKQKYFYALGSCILLYDYQIERRKLFSSLYGMVNNSRKIESIFAKYEYYVKEYATYQISDSQYAYATYLQRINADAQDIYEYLFRAVYEAPGQTINEEALLDLLIYHVNPRVIYKKNQINFEVSLIEAITNYKPNFHAHSFHMKKAVNLMLTHYKMSYMTNDDFDMVHELLQDEALAHPEMKEDYDALTVKFDAQFKINRRLR